MRSRGIADYDRPTFDATCGKTCAPSKGLRPWWSATSGCRSPSRALAGVPYINSATRNGAVRRPQWPFPHAVDSFVPPALGDLAFRAVRPLAFRLQAKGWNQAASTWPAVSVGSVRHYSDGDVTLYADPREPSRCSMVPLAPSYGSRACHRAFHCTWWDALNGRTASLRDPRQLRKRRPTSQDH